MMIPPKYNLEENSIILLTTLAIKRLKLQGEVLQPFLCGLNISQSKDPETFYQTLKHLDLGALVVWKKKVKCVTKQKNADEPLGAPTRLGDVPQGPAVRTSLLPGKLCSEKKSSNAIPVIPGFRFCCRVFFLFTYLFFIFSNRLIYRVCRRCAQCARSRAPTVTPKNVFSLRNVS